MSSTDVSVGSFVAAGDIIGKSGTLMFDGNEGFCLMASVFDTVINVDTVLEKFK